MLLSALDLCFRARILHVCISSLWAKAEIGVCLQLYIICLYSCVSVHPALSLYSKFSLRLLLVSSKNISVKETERHLVIN